MFSKKIIDVGEHNFAKLLLFNVYVNCSQGWYQPSNSCKKHFNEISEIWVVGPLQSTICLALLYGVDT